MGWHFHRQDPGAFLLAVIMDRFPEFNDQSGCNGLFPLALDGAPDSSPSGLAFPLPIGGERGRSGSCPVHWFDGLFQYKILFQGIELAIKLLIDILLTQVC